MNCLSEIDIINSFLKLSSAKNCSMLKGIGDDCAVFPAENGICKVITSDTLTEGSHFILDQTTAADLAYKSLASNISDIISMGASPKYALIAFTFTKSIDKIWMNEFVESFGELATSYNIQLIGGDTTYSDIAITITITLIGEAKEENLKFRSGAVAGDSIFCVNKLGASALGLKNLRESNISHPSVELHFRPKLFMQEALWLSTQKEIGAMMDISDGIAKDILHIMEQSSVGANINIDNLPIYEGADLSMALEGGEEYSLLFTVRKEETADLMRKYKEIFKKEIFEIGTITSNINELKWISQGSEISCNFKGYEHGKQ